MSQVVAALIERHGRILIGQRRKEAPHPLKWEFPGGKVEAGETPETALARELKEELAIQANIGGEIARYDHAPIELIFYSVTDFQGEPRNLAFERITWEHSSRLVDYDFLDGDIDFIRTRLAYSDKEVERINMSETKKCAHPACNCPAANDSKYCSQYCHDAARTTELFCNCGHAGCADQVAQQA